jgi:hypothetical protein
MKNRITILLFLVSLAIYSCGSNERSRKIADFIPSQGESSTNLQPPEKIEIQEVRKIIREGDITFETSDVNETKSLITKATLELNGYITKESANDYADRIEQALIIRVPADKFDLLLAKISESARKIESKNINALDVTEEFIDVEARLKTKKELENRYRELLAKATKVEEIMSIEKEIGQLRADIESVEGRLRYLKDKVSFSSLTVTYYQKINSAFGFSSKFGQALKYGWKNLLWFFIGITTIWPFIILLGGGLFAGYRISRKKRNRAKGA